MVAVVVVKRKFRPSLEERAFFGGEREGNGAALTADDFSTFATATTTDDSLTDAPLPNLLVTLLIICLYAHDLSIFQIS